MIRFVYENGNPVFVNPYLVEYIEYAPKAYLIHVASGKFLAVPIDNPLNVHGAEVIVKQLGQKGGRS